jgi:WW domain-containing oxidoreductase
VSPGRPTGDTVVAGLDLQGRSIAVTGANSGIGFEAARSLAGAGAEVLLACRTQGGAEDAARRIRALHPDASVLPLALDLASFASIRRFAAALPVTRLHALICNAGVYLPRYEETEDGIERTVGVCHFGHSLLVSLLLGALRAAAPARVVMVSSESHRHPATLDFARFPLTSGSYGALRAYGQAKLCNVLFANELTRRFGTEGVFANALHPGSLIGTSIFRNSAAAKLVGVLARPFVKTLAEGAATSVYCAVAPALEGVGGRYYSDCREKPASAGARDEAAAARLFEVTAARSEPA